MSSGASNSGWQSTTPNYADDDEWDFPSGTAPTYGGHTGHNDVVAPEYPGYYNQQQSAYTEDFFPAASDYHPNQLPSMVSTTHTPSNIQRSYSNLDSPGTISLQSYQNQSL
jgi:hypothetical protein